VAITSLVTYDFYRSYINPAATGKKFLFVSRIAVVSFGLVAAATAVHFACAGISVSFIVTAIGMIIDGEVLMFLRIVAGFRIRNSLYRVLLSLVSALVLEEAKQICGDPVPTS
jgi:Na+/proline symporter